MLSSALCEKCGQEPRYIYPNGRVFSLGRNCKNSINREGYAKNLLEQRERSRVKSITYRKNHAEELSRSSREYYAKHRNIPEFMRKNVLNNLRWVSRNKQKSLSIKADYRARKRNAFVESIDRSIVFEVNMGLCGICGEFVDPSDFAVDHIIPLSRGGLHAYNNVQLTHVSCNLEKGSRIY